jgi:hypothetical protein
MKLLIKACLIKENFTMSAMVIRGEDLGYNFQQNGFHGGSPSLTQNKNNTPDDKISNECRRLFISACHSDEVSRGRGRISGGLR